MNRSTETDSEEGQTLRRSTRTRKGAVPPIVSENSSGSETESTNTEVDYNDVSREWSTETAAGELEGKMSKRDQGREESKDSGKESMGAPGMSEFMQIFLEENRRREDEYRRREKIRREDERLRREEAKQIREEERRAREAAESAREDRLIRALHENHIADTPPTVTQTYELSRMNDKHDIEAFVNVFEAELETGHVPANRWKDKLFRSLTLEAKTKVQAVVRDEHSTYYDLKKALVGGVASTFSAASEDMCTM